jgi:uncharacterized protein YndB with AHSA1/START domain
MPTDTINNVSSAAVQQATGKSWDEWLAALDGDGATEMTHPQIALLVHEKYGAPDWWSQMVTVGYEQARGLRAKYQKADGFTASASRTVNVPVDVLFNVWADDAQRARWLPGAPLAVRKATPGKSLRLSWEGGGSKVDVELTAKGEAKSQVAVQHTRLPDAEAAAAMKAYWGDALDRMKAQLTR